MDRISVSSPSKVNLHLRVGSPRADGFHPLRSWMVTTSLCDEIEFRRTASGIRLVCNDRSIPTDASNLIVRAANLILDEVPPDRRIGLAIQLSKRLPGGAGLGGGSANGATALSVVNKLLGCPVHVDHLPTRAAQLGSDVPFFLGPPSAIATGRGEALSPIPAPIARFSILILPPFPISTAQAYRALDDLRPREMPGTLDTFDAEAWSRLPAQSLLGHLKNDLEPAAYAIEPRLGELRTAIETKLGRVVRMSGSGSTLFTLFDSADDARHAARSVRGEFKMRVEEVELGGDFRDPTS